MLVDSHCHLSCNPLYEDLDGVIKRADMANVKYILNAGGKFDELNTQLEISRRFPHVFTATGVHPHNAAEYAEVSAADVLQNVNYSSVIAIGECGLDYYYDFCPKDIQIKIFAQMIAAAQESGLPLIVHTRDAEEDTAEILQKSYKTKPFKGVIHCYSSKWEIAAAALEIGFYISASGIITFKNSQDLRDCFTKVPLDKLLIETDGPYLAPVPHRGKTNEPQFMTHTAACLAELKGVDFKQICAITSQNFFNLFNKAQQIESKGKKND